MKLLEFAKQNGYNMISPVRKNENGYPFITFMDKNNTDHVENIYLSINAASTVTVGAVITTSDWRCVDTENANGEKRVKLTNSLGEYQELF